MAYVFVVMGILAIAYLMWRAYGPTANAGRPKTAVSGPKGPDDDPDFLMDLDRRARGEE
ncbi:MAG: hypothetical protein QM662_19690 [Gordonia sp. (in: high G+C Gram-positive bacteria)]